MNVKMLLCAAVMTAGVGQYLNAAVVRDIKIPRLKQKNLQFYERYNKVFVNDFSARNANIGKIILAPDDQPIPGGTYYAYIKLYDVKSKAPLELAINDNIQTIQPENTGNKFLGPVKFTTSRSFTTLDFRASTKLWIAAVKLTDAPDVSIPSIATKVPPQGDTVWISWGDSVKYPWWFQLKQPVCCDFNYRGNGDAQIKITVYDYNHQSVGNKSVTVIPGDKPPVELPVPEKYGSYVIKFSIVCADGRKIEQQKICARVSPPTSKASPMLGGHGNSALILAMGGGFERLWDTNQGLLWKNVEKKQGTFKFDGKLPPGPLKPLVVLDGKPKWAPDMFTNPSGFYKYADALSKEYKGRVAVYEIFNERYGEWRKNPAKTAEIIKHTAEIIRKNDPSVRIATGGPPEEISPGYGTWEEMCRQKVFDGLDTITGHFYVGAGGTHPLDQDLQFDAYVTSVKELLKRNGHGKKQLIDSEAGICPMESFYLGQPPRYGLWGSKGFSDRTPVSYLVATPMYTRLLLYHLFHRVPWMIYHTSNSYGNSWSMSDGDMTPMPAAVAIAQAMRLLENAVPYKKLRLPQGFTGLTFRLNKKIIVIFWAVKLKMGERCMVTCGAANVKVLDMFCNPLPLKKEYSVGADPVYVIGTGRNINKFFTGLKSRSIFEKGLADTGRFDQLVSKKGVSGFRVSAPKSMPKYSTACLYDEEKVSSGSPADCWQPAVAGSLKSPVSVLYQWSYPRKINWITVGWANGARPAKYKVEWFDGIKWHCVTGTWGWRKPNETVESYPIREIKTKKLRLSFINQPDHPVKVSEFSALFAPRLTPQITEMQEVYNSDFNPDKQGFITDWLLCGPFPATGNRYTTKTPPKWNKQFLSNHYHYGGQYNDKTINPKVDQRHFVTFTSNPQTKWRTGKATVHWFPYHSKAAYVDFAAAFKAANVFPAHDKPIENCYGYAVCYITLKHDFKGTLAVGSDDGYKIMIDKKEIAQKIIYRGAVKDQEKYPVNIKAGEHRLLVRVHNDINGHGFFLRFLKPDATPFSDYKVKLIR